MLRLYKTLVVLSILGALATMVLARSLQGREWTLIVGLPASYVVFASLLGWRTWSTGPSLFVATCLPTAFLRYVAFPALASINEGYVGRSPIPPADSSVNLAIILMSYELLLIGLLLMVLEPRYHRRKSAVQRSARVLPFWYVIAIAASALAFAFVVPASFLPVNIFRPRSLDGDGDLPAIAALIAMTLLAAKVFLFLGLSRRLAATAHWKRFVPWLAALLCAGNIMVFFGANRMAMVLTGVASIWIFRQLFGRRGMKPIIAIVAFTGLVFSAITEERDYYEASDSRLVNIADNIQTYTGGIYNVAVGLEVPLYYAEATDPSVLAYDFLRPTIGFNLIAQSWDLYYSNIYFNYRMFVYGDRRSQILPMIAQGHLFFPAFLSPALSILFVALAYKLLNVLGNASYLEIRYALAIVILRLGFFWGQNSMNMMNFISLHLIVPLCLLAAYFALRGIAKRGHTPQAAVFGSGKPNATEGSRT